MKVCFDVPGRGISKNDALKFSDDIMTEYGIETKFNIDCETGSDPVVVGMSVEGEDDKVNAFIGTYLGHVNWLRIK